MYVIIGHDAPDAKEKRPQHRPAHLVHRRPLAEAGKVVLAGPLTNGSGSLIVLDTRTAAETWEIVARDPYVVHGVFAHVEVHPFRQVFPEPDAAN